MFFFQKYFFSKACFLKHDGKHIFHNVEQQARQLAWASLLKGVELGHSVNIRLACKCLMSKWCHEIQHNDTLHNDTEYNNTKHKDTQDSDTQYNDTHHNNTEHKVTEHNDTEHNNNDHNDTQDSGTQHNDTVHQISLHTLF